MSCGKLLLLPVKRKTTFLDNRRHTFCLSWTIIDSSRLRYLQTRYPRNLVCSGIKQRIRPGLLLQPYLGLHYHCAGVWASAFQVGNIRPICGETSLVLREDPESRKSGRLYLSGTSPGIGRTILSSRCWYPK